MTEFDLSAFVTQQFDSHLEAVAATRAAIAAPFADLVTVCAESLTAGGRILFFGNGGSAADAQHLATELTVRYASDRGPLAGLALTTDSSTLTAAGNDYGFAEIFARQIAALGRPGDVAIGLSTSGRSANITRALAEARRLGLTAAALSGRDGGDLVGLAEPLVIVPCQRTDRIQEMHGLIGHMLCHAMEQRLGMLG